MKPVFNTILRLLSLGARFYLFVFLAARAEMADLGYFGKFQVAVLLVSIVLGLDLYNHTIRHHKQGGDVNMLFQTKMKIVGVNYLLVSSILVSVLFKPLGIDRSHQILFLVIVLFEYLSQEGYRFLIYLARQVQASLLLFTKSALWILVFVLVVAINDELYSLNVLFYTWCGSLVVATLFAVYLLRDQFELRYTRTSMAQCLGFLKSSIPLFLAGVLLKATVTIDRYMVDWISTVEFLGVYVFYFGLINAVLAIMDAAVIQMHFPMLVRYSGPADDRMVVKAMASIFLIAVGAAAGFYALAPSLILYLNQQILLDYMHIFYVLVIFSVFWSVSAITNLVLYALKVDVLSLVANAVSFVSFIVIVSVMSAYGTIELEYVVPVGLVVSTGINLLIKTSVWRSAISKI